MAVEQFANNAATTLDAAIETTDGTSLTVTSYAGFPSVAQFRILIDSEIMLVTAGAGTTTWTVTRGAEGSTAATHLDEAVVTHILTAGALAQLKTDVAATSLPLAGGTMAGELVVADQLVTRPELKDYAETVNPIGGTGGGTQDIDLTVGNVVSATVDTSANTFTFSNPSASGKACSFTLILTNGGSQTVNWPAAVKWAGDVAPTLTAAGVDILTFVTIDAGTIWYGFAAGLAMA
jgi:hypothetical protein